MTLNPLVVRQDPGADATLARARVVLTQIMLGQFPPELRPGCQHQERRLKGVLLPARRRLRTRKGCGCNGNRDDPALCIERTARYRQATVKLSRRAGLAHESLTSQRETEIRPPIPCRAQGAVGASEC